MKVETTTFRGRRAWRMDTGQLELVMLQGGGHIASLALRDRPELNPLWVPVWRTIEPWAYRPRHAARYGSSRLLAAISGHNPCLGWFGEPSAAEAAAGMLCHGEAPVARWKLEARRVSARSVKLVCGCELPAAQLALRRTLTARAGTAVVHVHEEISNRSRRDLPFTMSQHVTFGPPFLEKGVTVFDMPATRAHTFPGAFSDCQRLRTDAVFTWPRAPGSRRESVDLRTIDRRDRKSSDFTTQLMDPRRDFGWFSAINPRLGLLAAYVWPREQFPWIGNWEENYGRRQAPWGGRSLTRGMEFANAPFPEGLRAAVDRGRFLGEKTFAWVPARRKVGVDYTIILSEVPKDVCGISDIRPVGNDVAIDMIRPTDRPRRKGKQAA